MHVHDKIEARMQSDEIPSRYANTAEVFTPEERADMKRELPRNLVSRNIVLGSVIVGGVSFEVRTVWTCWERGTVFHGYGWHDTTEISFHASPDGKPNQQFATLQELIDWAAAEIGYAATATEKAGA